MRRKTSTMPTPYNIFDTILIVSTMASLEPKYSLALEILPGRFLFLTTFVKIIVSICSAFNDHNFSSLDIVTSLASCHCPFTSQTQTNSQKDLFVVLPSKWLVTDALVLLLSRIG
jgi:hypothetical protein